MNDVAAVPHKNSIRKRKLQRISVPSANLYCVPAEVVAVFVT
jgi:hypothetical protein